MSQTVELTLVRRGPGRGSIAEDIETFHDFMEMEAATRGVTHFNEERPEFEGTTEQKIGLIVNFGVTFLGFVIFVAGIVAWVVSVEQFVGVAKLLVFDGFCMMALAITVELGIRRNNMDMVAYANGSLCFFAFLTLVLGIVSRLASGGLSDLDKKIDDDFEEILDTIEYEDPTFCGLPNARFSTAACKDKVNRFLVSNVEIVAYIASCIVAVMAVIMYITHGEVRQFYTGHEGEKEVNGALDRKIKAMIDAQTDHVRRLNPEELRRIEGWLNARKEGRDALHKLDADELIAWVIESTHKDDDHDPHNEDAQERLKKGDEYIYRNKPIDAAVEYKFGREIEPGNPKLKHRLEVTRR